MQRVIFSAFVSERQCRSCRTAPRQITWRLNLYRFFYTTLGVTRNPQRRPNTFWAGSIADCSTRATGVSFICLTATRRDETIIDRDCYGGIPLFYSVTKPIVSTDLRLFANMHDCEFIVRRSRNIFPPLI